MKELRETRRWLKLIGRASLVSQSTTLEPVIDETDQFIRNLVTSISTPEKR